MQAFHILRNIQVDSLILPLIRIEAVIYRHSSGRLHTGVLLQLVQFLFLLAERILTFICHGDIKFEDIPILLHRNFPDGILNTKAGYQQGTAAADSNHRHEETLFIAKDIPRSHLVNKIESLPYKWNTLQ